MKKSTNYDSVEIEIADVTLFIEYDYEYDAGYWRNANGDGLPSSYTLDIISVSIGDCDITDFLHEYAPKAFEAIENAVYESINK